MDISSLISAGGPVVVFLGQILAIGVFVFWLMKGLNIVVFIDMQPVRRKFWKRLSAHALGPIITVLLFGARILEMPVRKFWGYTLAAVMGWAGSLVAVAWHNRKKAKTKGRLP